jgi:hypothetical protein
MNEAHPVPKPTRTPSQRGRASKRKGYRGEKKWAQFIGGERVPLSGALGGELSGDVRQPELGITYEVKSPKGGFDRAFGWLEIEPGHGVENVKHSKAVEDGRKRAPDALVVLVDNSPPLVVMTGQTWRHLLNLFANARAQAERGWVPRAIEHLESLGRVQ